MNIKELREGKGLSINQISHLLYITPSAYQNIEAGKWKAERVIGRLCEILGVREEYLTGEFNRE